MTTPRNRPPARSHVALLFLLTTLALWGCDSTPDADDPLDREDLAAPDINDSALDVPDDAASADAPDTSTGRPDADEGPGDAADTEAPRDVESDDASAEEVETPPDPSTCGYGHLTLQFCASQDQAEYIYRDFTLTLTGQDCNSVEHTFFAHLTFNDLQTYGEYYTFERIPSGVYDMYFENHRSFSPVKNIFIAPDQILEFQIGRNNCFRDLFPPDVAVLSGAHDSIEEVFEELDLPYAWYQGDGADLVESDQRDGQNLLAAANGSALQDELMGQEILIINSGDWLRVINDPERAEDVANMRANLQRFVNSGKPLYIGDRALPLLELAFPEMLDLHGDDMSVQVFAGIPTMDLDVNVLSEEMQRVLRDNPVDALTEHITVNLDSMPWTLIEDVVRTNVTVHLSAPEVNVALGGEITTLHDVPLLVSFQPTPTSGRVYFSVIPSDSNSEHMKSFFKWLSWRL